MRNKFLYYSLLVVVLLQSSQGYVTALGNVETSSNESLPETEKSVSLTGLTVSLRAATEKSIIFRPGKQESKTGQSNNKIPHLVLKRNGVLTPRTERTLIISVSNLVVPASGMYVQLILETQHDDPDLDRMDNIKIQVYKENRFIPYNALNQQGVRVQFNVTFHPITKQPHKTIKTPTDYYRYGIIVSDAFGNPLQTYVDDYAFLLENQWRVPLPDMLEMTPGAAPDELLVYYYDMIPFQANLKEPDSQIPREQVDQYIHTELIPAMVGAFWQQSNIWGFPWYEEWRNFRSDEDAKTLSVALVEDGIWFHGEPAALGHSMISIRVDGTAGEYDSLTDGLMSTFHHELFHNQQRNISLHFGSNGLISGKEEAWKLFSEGTAVLASSVGQPSVQFEATPQLRSYLKRANAFIGSEGAIGGGLNERYKEIPYHTALYWRFLYESCGGINDRGEDPATGMQVIRHALEALYKGEIVQINSSTDVAKAFPFILDHALQSTPSCPFRRYQDSLIHFARAIYGLRVEGGRCPGPIHISGCGFIDPDHLYRRPPVDSFLIAADPVTEVSGSIPSSYGIDLIELEFGPSVEDKNLKLIFSSNGDSNLAFQIEILKTKILNQDGEPERHLAQIGEPISMHAANGNIIIEIENVDNDHFDSLGLIITRMDSYEAIETTGAYSIKLIAE